MPQLTRCPHCQRELKIPDGAAGNLRCPLCQQIFAVRAAPVREPVAAMAASEAPTKLPNGAVPPVSVAAVRPSSPAYGERTPSRPS